MEANQNYRKLPEMDKDALNPCHSWPSLLATLLLASLLGHNESKSFICEFSRRTEGRIFKITAQIVQEELSSLKMFLKALRKLPWACIRYESRQVGNK